MALMGASTTKLIVLRGNSAAGKSTVARLLRMQLRAGPVDASRGYFRNTVALIEQDYIRRTLLGEYDRPGAVTIDVIDLCARTALDAGFDVVVEGMLVAARYADMLLALTAEHRGITHHWYFEADLELTLSRHRLRPQAAVVPDASLREWYQANDLLPEVEQRLVPGHWTAQHTADQITIAASPTPCPTRRTG